MKWMTICAAACVLLVAIAVMASGQTGSSDLIYKFHKGDVDRYRVTIDSKLTYTAGRPVGEPETTTIQQSWIVENKVIEALADGSAKVQVSKQDYTINGKKGATQPQPVIATVAPDGKILALEDPAKPGAIKPLPGAEFSALTSGIAGYPGVLLPPIAVKVGDKWEYNVAAPLASGTAKITNTVLSATEQMNGRLATKIGFVVDSSIDLAKLTSAAASTQTNTTAQPLVTGRTDITGSGNLYFTQESGKLLRLDVSITSKETSTATSGTTPSTPVSRDTVGMVVMVKIE